MSAADFHALCGQSFHSWLGETVMIRGIVARWFDISEDEAARIPLRDLYELYRLIGEEEFS